MKKRTFLTALAAVPYFGLWLPCVGLVSLILSMRKKKPGWLRDDNTYLVPELCVGATGDSRLEGLSQGPDTIKRKDGRKLYAMLRCRHVGPFRIGRIAGYQLVSTELIGDRQAAAFEMGAESESFYALDLHGNQIPIDEPELKFSRRKPRGTILVSS